MPKITIISGHPRANSFTEQLTKSYEAGAKAAGYETALFTLPTLDIGSTPFAGKPELSDWSAGLHTLWANMLDADHIVFAHPLWWGSMPGEFKMLFDRLLVSGNAYSYQNGKAFPVGHLKGRTAEVIMTSDTPNWFYKLAYHSAQSQLMKNQILKFIGLKPIRFTHISPIRSMNEEQRNRKLQLTFELPSSLGHKKRKSAA